MKTVLLKSNSKDGTMPLNLLRNIIQDISSRKKITWLTFLAVSMCCINVSAQPIIPSMPTSPQAESIKLHGEFGINYSTGIPDINIPLFEINHYGYKLPVSLRYYPQPLKPGYNYDVFGHGWGLSVNSCVSRTIKYIHDEDDEFKLVNQEQLGEYYEFTKGTLHTWNMEHDQFNVTLPDGSSFDFIMDRDSQNKLRYVISNGRSVQINYIGPNLSSFIVIDENGIKYTFEEADRPYMTPGQDAFVSWQLVRIDLPHVPDKPILFNHNYALRSLGCSYAEAAFFISHLRKPLVPLPEDRIYNIYHGRLSSQSNTTPYRMKLLSYIKYGNIRIDFTFKDENTSTSSPPAHNHVTGMRIINADNGECLKTIKFQMDECPLSAIGAPVASIFKLKSVEINNENGNGEKFECGYLNTGGFYIFNGLDHWGNYNRASSSYDLGIFNAYIEFNVNLHGGRIRDFLIEKSPQDLCPYSKIRFTRTPMLDNRAPSSPSTHGVLGRLTYPSGGHTIFQFENNRCLTSTDEFGDYIHDKSKKRAINAGGFRIKEITNYTAENIVARSKSFKYGSPMNDSDDYTGAGEAVVDPNILSYANFNYMNMPGNVKDMLIGLNCSGKPFTGNTLMIVLDVYMPLHTCYWECSFSASNFRRLLDGRPSVVYPEVAVYYKDAGDIYSENTAGKTVYKYDILEPALSDTAFFEKPQYYGNMLFYEAHPYRYNTLIEKSDYKYSDNRYTIKKKEEYKYIPSTVGIVNYIWNNICHSDEDSHYNKWCAVGDCFDLRPGYLGINRLSEKSVTIYEDYGDEINTLEEYQYNGRNQIRVISVKNSNNTRIRTTMTYPQPNPYGTTSDIVNKMLAKNIISPVLEKITSNGTTISGTKIDYEEFQVDNTTLIMPAKSYDLGIEEFQLQEEILRYSSYGNPLEVATKDGIHTVLLWSYDGQYPVAQIVNATYSEVSALINCETFLNKSVLMADDINVLNTLRTQLPNALVTTYTYKPFVGVASVTDPRGISNYYDYDNLGRLKEVYYYENGIINSANKRKVENYDYHYRNP
jgi:hypothetical protein